MIRRGNLTGEEAVQERRQYNRLPVRLDVRGHTRGPGQVASFRALTTNISTGGVHIEIDVDEHGPTLQPRDVLELELRIPPGEGHFPYEGRVMAVAEVVRCAPLPAQPDAPAQRLAVAARFDRPLDFRF